MKDFANKKNLLLLIAAALAPFLITALDWGLLRTTSIFHEYVMPFVHGSAFMAYALWSVFLIGPSLLLLSFLQLPLRQRVIAYAAVLLICFPLTTFVYLLVGMEIMDVYP